MALPRRRVLGMLAGAAVVPAAARVARAQAYPARPITMIVPYAAGGPTDTIGRTVAERMRAELGQPIVLENVTGAAGSIGLGRVARATTDGYTINVGNWSAHVVNGAIYTLPYDLRSDFAPIALLAQAPQLVLASKKLPADDPKGLIAWMKANPGKATIGTAGVGSPPHIAAVFFLSLTGTTAQLVSYRGGGPAVQDLVAGQIDLVFGDPTSAVPQVRAGTIKALAIAAAERLPALPEVPTPTRPGCWAFMLRPGTRCSHPRVRLRTSSSGSMRRRSPLWRTPRCGPGSPISARTCQRGSGRHRRRSAPCLRLTSRSGGRSSRLPASSRSKSCHLVDADLPTPSLPGLNSAQSIVFKRIFF